DPLEVLAQASKLRSEAAELEATRSTSGTPPVIQTGATEVEKRMNIAGSSWRLKFSLDSGGMVYGGDGGIVVFRPDGYTDWEGGDFSKVWGWDMEATSVVLEGGAGNEFLLLFSADVDPKRWGMVPEGVRSAWSEGSSGGGGKVYFTGEFGFTERGGFEFRKGTVTVKVEAGRKKLFGWLTVGIDKNILASFKRCGSFVLEPFDE
ncbi:hypothetical protein TrRE_jg13526, partial [Triparma retinervis]